MNLQGKGKITVADLNITILNGQGEVRGTASGEDELLLVWEGEYKPGDFIRFETDDAPGFYVIRVDGAMDEAYVYMTQEKVEYTIPFEEKKASYNPVSFTGTAHYITMRRAGAEENRNYRNLCKNVMDQQNGQGCYPHASANIETRGEALFAARNAIDGVVANLCHYPWPYQSWGIGRRADAEITVEFGRPVDMEELRLYTRADFPHDSWWTRATVTFSDGSREVVEMEKSVKPHSFPIQRKGVTWIRLSELIKADDPSPFPALTQIEAYGRNAQ